MAEQQGHPGSRTPSWLSFADAAREEPIAEEQEDDDDDAAAMFF